MKIKRNLDGEDLTKRKLAHRACCAAGAARGRGWVVPDDVDVAYGLASTNGPILARIDDAEVDRSTCVHEAAHAAIAHGFGQRIASASAMPPAQVCHANPSQASPVERIAELWAAPAAEAAAMHRRITLGIDDEADYLERVRKLEFGGCDGCSMALVAWSAHGLNAGIDAARAVLREGQLLALELLDRRDVRAAIRALADKLEEGEIVSGEACHELLERHLPFGSLRAEGPQKR